MNVGRYVLGSVVVLIYFYFYEWIFHGIIMRKWYGMQMSLFRPDMESGIFLLWMLLGLIILAFGFCFIFLKGYEKKGIGEGFRYGLYVGFTFSVSTSLIEFSIFPYPGSWVIGWIIGYLIMMILAGIIFAAIYKPKAA